MPLTDLSTVSLQNALRYASQFGLNRSQGIYFHQIVQKAPPDTYLADLKHVVQPFPISLLGRLLREASGTVPLLISQGDDVNLRRVLYDFGPSQIAENPNVVKPVPPFADTTASSTSLLLKADSASTPIRQELALPPPVTSFATLPAQLPPLSLPMPETRSTQCQRSWTNTPYPYTSLITGVNLEPQDLHYYSTGTIVPSGPIQQEDMDCSPPSPILLSDVDMDMLSDIAPAPPSYDTPWSQWNMIPEYAPSTLVDPFWKTPIHDQYNSELAAPVPLYAAVQPHWQNDPVHSLASAVPTPLNLNLPLPVEIAPQPGPVNSPVQNAPHRPGTPHPSSVATLLGDFERSLTLVADDDTSRPELVPPDSSPDDSPPLERESTEPYEEGRDQPPPYFLNLVKPPPFEREPTEPLEEPPCPLTSFSPTSLPRPPTPPRTRRPTPSSSIDHKIRSAHLRPPSDRLAARAAKSRALQTQLGDVRALRTLPGRVHLLRDEDPLEGEPAGTSAGRRRRMVVAVPPSPIRSRRRRQKDDRDRERETEKEKEEAGGEGIGEDDPDRRSECKKRTRFVVPRPGEDTTHRDARMSTAGRPVRSILRNSLRHAARGPYQMASRHAGRRASVA